jgi:hypothetical protein
MNDIQRRRLVVNDLGEEVFMEAEGGEWVTYDFAAARAKAQYERGREQGHIEANALLYEKGRNVGHREALRGWKSIEECVADTQRDERERIRAAGRGHGNRAGTTKPERSGR